MAAKPAGTVTSALGPVLRTFRAEVHPAVLALCLGLLDDLVGSGEEDGGLGAGDGGGGGGGGLLSELRARLKEAEARAEAEATARRELEEERAAAGGGESAAAFDELHSALQKARLQLAEAEGSNRVSGSGRAPPGRRGR